MQHRLLFTALCLSLCLVTACGGSRKDAKPDEAGGPRYADPTEAQAATRQWSTSDLLQTAEAMTQSLLESEYIAKSREKPRVRLREVKNETYENLDTRSIGDRIRVGLLKSGRVIFLADDGNLGEVRKEQEFNTNLAKAENVPLMTSDYILTGAVRSTRRTVGGASDIFYEISLQLTDARGQIVWGDIKDIRKVIPFEQCNTELVDIKAARLEGSLHCKYDENYINDKFMVVAATLRSTGSAANRTYRVEWLDESGRRLEQSSWRPLIVKVGETARFTERSTVPGATKCLFHFSSAR